MAHGARPQAAARTKPGGAARGVTGGRAKGARPVGRGTSWTGRHLARRLPTTGGERPFFLYCSVRRKINGQLKYRQNTVCHYSKSYYYWEIDRRYFVL